jgi:hypothetical protein
MERTAVGPDGMTIEFSAYELATLTDLIGQEIEVQERRTGPLDDEVRETLQRAYKVFAGSLSASWQLQEALASPFGPGERVVAEPQFAAEVDLGPSGSAEIIREHGRDARHDYDWCDVRRDDGSEIELPSIYLRRAQLPNQP